MSRKSFVLVILLSVLAGASGVFAEKTEPSPDVQRWLSMYEPPGRIAWQKPPTVLRLLAIEPGDKIADLGTGTGYFLPRLSLSVGDTGKVYAVDINQELLDFVKTRRGMQAENIIPILAKPNDPMLPEDELDLVLILNTWHHIKGRVKYLKKVAAGLNPWGRVVLIDFHAGDLPVGPPAREKLSREEVIAEFKKAGWAFGGESVALPYQYYLVFTPPAGS